MQLIRRTLIICFLFIGSNQSEAQTKEQVFSQVQQLLNKAVGEKLKDFSGEEKITRQVFTTNEVSCYKKGLSKYGSEWVHRYSNIPWNDFFEHVIYDATSDGKLKTVKLSFKKYFKSEFFTSDKPGDDDPSQYNRIELYVKEKDKDEMDKLLNALYKLKEKKPESPLNAQIRNFTKAQTIAWLRDKFNTYLSGGQYDRDIKIVSLDECKMVLTYSGLVRKYEAEIPMKIKTINKYGTFEYADKIAAVRTTTPDMIVDGKKTYSQYAAIGISNNDEEVVENIECAMKHLAGFCGGIATTTTTTTTNSGTVSSSKPSTAAVSSSSGVASSSSAGLPVSTANRQWYMLFNKGKTFGTQSWISRQEFPSSDIAGKWKEGYYITDVSYGGPDDKWFITFSKFPGYTNQLWRTRETRADAMKVIDEIWKDNPTYKVTCLTYINGLWVVVATEGTPVTQQVYLWNEKFPEEDIKKYWKEKYDVTSMGYSSAGWLVIMSQGYNYKNQRLKKLEATSNWDHQKIAEEAKQGFYLTCVEKAGSTWHLVLTNDDKAGTSEYRIADKFSSFEAGIRGQWDKGFSIDRMVYIPARN